MQIRNILKIQNTHSTTRLINVLSQSKRRMTSKPTINFVEELLSKQAKIAVIPPELQTELLTDIARTVKFQRQGRLQGMMFYPSVSALSTSIGSLSLTMSILAYTPVCVGLHHLAILHACRTARDLVTRQQVFYDENANLALKKWIKDNNITNLSFNGKSELMLFSKDSISSLRRLAWLDKTSLKTTTQHFGISSLPISFKSQNTINYFHLTEEVRKKISHLLKARSIRFRYPLCLGVAGGILGSSSYMYQPLMSIVSFFIGTVLGRLTNHHTINQDTKDLWEYIGDMKSLSEMIAPEYREGYSSLLSENDTVKIVINVFGDIVVNPNLTMRSSAMFLFSHNIHKENEMNNKTEQPDVAEKPGARSQSL